MYKQQYQNKKKKEEKKRRGDSTSSLLKTQGKKVKIGTTGWDRTELDTATASLFWLKLKFFSSAFSSYLTHPWDVSSPRIQNRHRLCPPNANPIPYFGVHKANQCGLKSLALTPELLNSPVILLFTLDMWLRCFNDLPFREPVYQNVYSEE